MAFFCSTSSSSDGGMSSNLSFLSPPRSLSSDANNTIFAKQGQINALKRNYEADRSQVLTLVVFLLCRRLTSNKRWERKEGKKGKCERSRRKRASKKSRPEKTSPAFDKRQLRLREERGAIRITSCCLNSKTNNNNSLLFLKLFLAFLHQVLSPLPPFPSLIIIHSGNSLALSSLS